MLDCGPRRSLGPVEVRLGGLRGREDELGPAEVLGTGLRDLELLLRASFDVFPRLFIERLRLRDRESERSRRRG